MNKKYLVIIFVLLFAILCISFFGIKKSYARYSSSIEGTNTIDVAVSITETNMESTIPVKLSDMFSGSTLSYNFTVTNFIDNDITETKMSYVIKINNSDNMPVDIKLYKNSVEENILDSTLESTPSDLIINEKQTDNYTLIVDWSSSNNDYQYAGYTDYLDIIITSSQVIDN